MRIVFVLLSCCIFAGQVSAVPVQVLPAPQPAQWDWLQQASPGAHRFAMALPANIDSDRQGQWTHTAQHSIWQLTLLASGAQSLSFQLDQLVWPESAELWLRDSRGQTQGPLSQADVIDGQLWTPQVFSDTVHLELRIASGEAAHLRVHKAFYGARPLIAKHGNCNIDTQCATSGDFDDQIDSTVLLQFSVGGGLSACSGLLINNTRNDQTPYILTADHCQINQPNQGSVRVYWRYEDPNCGNPPGHANPEPNSNFSLAGVQVLADGFSSDFTLLVLGSADNPRAIPAEFEPYWSGWDAGTLAPQFGVTVHHPSGNEKSITPYDEPAVATQTNIDGRLTDAWRVFWSQGTTEQGSSGSGLWNEDNRVVGVLSGGEASCQNPDAPDFYGRLTAAWQEGEACDKQLKYWLDPDNLGRLVQDGIGPQGRSDPEVPFCAANAGGGGSSGALSWWWLGLMILLARQKRLIPPR